MPVGNTDTRLNKFEDLGFRFVNELTILGMIIKGNCENYAENEANIINKIVHECNKWQRFNLSLPGRINIAKTMLYSQLNYLGCFLLVSANLISTAENLITNFVRWNLRTAEKRFFDELNLGGFGLFRVKPFLALQCCSWVKRAENLDEVWKMDLREMCIVSEVICLTVRRSLSFFILLTVMKIFYRVLRELTVILKKRIYLTTRPLTWA
jgi:hypothetical protein